MLSQAVTTAWRTELGTTLLDGWGPRAWLPALQRRMFLMVPRRRSFLRFFRYPGTTSLSDVHAGFLDCRVARAACGIRPGIRVGRPVFGCGFRLSMGRISLVWPPLVSVAHARGSGCGAAPAHRHIRAVMA